MLSNPPFNAGPGIKIPNPSVVVARFLHFSTKFTPGTQFLAAGYAISSLTQETFQKSLPIAVCTLH
jgi:hypothetical protein